MSATNLNIRTDKDVKEQAEQIFAELGLNMTTAINLFLRAAIRKHGIPVMKRPLSSRNLGKTFSSV
jgi:DNA-damage-inducible protein J